MSSAAPGAAASASKPAAGAAGERSSAWWGVALVLAVATGLIAWAGRDVAVIGDEWAWVFGALDIDAETIVQDYNGHLLATTWPLYHGLLVTFGLPEYWTLRAVALIVHLAVVVLVFLLARRRVGAWPAVAPTAATAFLGTGSDVFLSGLNIGIAAAMAACLGALVLLDRHTRGADLGACAMLVIGLASFTSAVAFTAGVYAELLRRRDRWKRIWVAVVPTVLYASWRLRWGESPGGDEGSEGVLDALGNALEAAAGAVAGVGGVQLASPTVKDHFPWLDSLAQVAVALGVATLAWLLGRRRDVSPRLANLIVTGAALWLLIALGRGSLGDPFASRYVYQGAIVVVLIAVELAAMYKIRGRALSRAVLLAVAGTAVLNVAWLVVWSNHLRRESTAARAELAALDIARGRAPADFRPSPAFRLAAVEAGDYFAAVREFGGSPALTVSELRGASEANREAADRVLVGALGLRLVPGDSAVGGPAPALERERSSAAATATARNCLTVTPTGPAATVELMPRSPAGIVLETRPGAGLLVQARRFGERFQAGVGGVRGGPAILATPLGRAPDPWRLRVGANARTSICSLRQGR